jgi:hypothetical protein
VTAHVIAVTNSALESLNARFDAGEDNDPRARLMQALGAAYRHSGSEREDAAALNREIAAVQARVSRSLPEALQMGFEESLLAPPTDRHIDIRATGIDHSLREPSRRAPTRGPASLGGRRTGQVVAEDGRQVETARQHDGGRESEVVGPGMSRTMPMQPHHPLAYGRLSSVLRSRGQLRFSA